ncbi:MAG: chitobiase/beta-hexosaminidase C-terminal domain-containing protein, partial [Paramuribaculum sp.]|nr:chitobiase/beta-hexosaminidase C-terminal domain-containing protein [Paramuribaculum sp.]
MPEGGVEMRYVLVANTTIPVENWNLYDPNVGIELPQDAVFGQTTTIQIAAIDEDGFPGLIRTVICERVAPKAPDKPLLLQYSKAFDYESTNDLYAIKARIYPKGGWISAHQASTVYADGNALVLDLYDPYNNKYQNASTASNIVESMCGTLEYAITTYEIADEHTTFYPAETFQGTALASVQNTYGNQNSWFVVGFADEYIRNNNVETQTSGINNTPRNLFQSTGTSTGTVTMNNHIFLHLRAFSTTSSDERIYSDVLTLRIERTPLDAPIISKPSYEKYTWTGGAISRMTFAGNAVVNVVLPENAPEGTYIEYTFEGGTTHNVIPATTSRHKVDGTNAIIVNSQLMENQRNGRIFLHAKNDAQGIESEWVMFDIEQLQTQNFYTDNYAEPTGGFNQNALVLVNGSGANAINDKLRVVDVFATDAGLENGKTTYYVYLEDYFHNGLRLIVNSRIEPTAFSTYKKGADGKDRIIDAGEILGRISFQNQTVDALGNVTKTMPEILITPSATESYIDYLPDAVPGDFVTVNNPATNMVFCPDMLTVGATEFSRKVRVRGLESMVGYDDRVRDTEGNEYLLYPRVQVEGKNFRDQISSMEDGNKYAVTGYVGQTGGMLTLIPTEDIIECPDSPELFAPNPVTDGELNAISPELSIQIKNIRMPLAYFWSVGKVDPVTEFEKLNKVPASNIIVLEKTAYENAYPKNVCDLYVYSKSLDTEKNADELWCLEPTNITVTWHDVDHVVNSIAEFKEIYRGHEAELPEAISQRVAFKPSAYCQFDRDSRAVVIEATPEWLYVRDLQKPESGFSSNNYILIHNENQWVNPPVPVGTDGTETRMLSKGDIITNFALIPARSHRGNLISESTGFARTFWFQDSIENFDPETRVINVGYVDPDADQYYSNVLATKDECERFRMRLLEIKNVKVTKGGDADNPDYYLTIGNEDEMPIALAFDIFEECRNGWDNAYDPEDPDAVYDIKGVLIMNENVKDSESYAFAMIDFNTNKGQVANPKVYATGASNKDAEIQNFVLKLEINIDHEEGTSVFYSTNGKDPRVNTDAETRQVYDGPFEYTLPAGQDRMTLKAFAYKPGMKPSATVSRIFVKNSTDIQYIINFLNIARKDRFYRFTDNMKVISVGGKYAFLAGSMGGFLPIYKEDGWDNTEVAPGRYITNFTVGYTEDDHGNRMAVATGLGDSFNSVSSPRGGEGGDFPHLEKTPQEIEFHAEPDTITSLSELNARRLVTVMSVTLHKAASADLAQEEQWIIEDQQNGETHPFMVGRLGNVYVSSKGENGADVVEELRDGATYNITGFVMLGERNRAGSVEFWPVQANRVNRTAKPTARITNYTNRQVLENGDIIAQFHGTATVELRHNEPTASIYYKFDSESPEGNLSEGRWYLYQHPIVMTKSDVIRIKAQD